MNHFEKRKTCFKNKFIAKYIAELSNISQQGGGGFPKKFPIKGELGGLGTWEQFPSLTMWLIMLASLTFFPCRTKLYNLKEAALFILYFIVK